MSRPWNTYAYFRKTIDVPARPLRARARVSADARYTLYVNGTRIHHGPARCYPQHQSFDELDLAPLLHPGRNTVCAIVHQFGVPTFYSVYRDISGFLLDGSIECEGATAPIPLHTPDGWLCRFARGWKQDVVRMTIQMGFQEHFDANADPANWMSPEYDASEADGWKKPSFTSPVGYHPYLQMEPRGVPLLGEHEHDFAEVLWQFNGENARGYKIVNDVYHLPVTEERRKDNDAIQNADDMWRADELATVNPPEVGLRLVAELARGLRGMGLVRCPAAASR